MRSELACAAAMLLLAGGTPASAHRLDEYLQATTISVQEDRMEAQIRLAPGIAVLPIVLASIDTDGNGIVSKAEQRAYAERVLGDLSFMVDGDRVRLRLGSMEFPAMSEMKEGRGEIQIGFHADLAPGPRNRSLVFENHHQRRISVYLVNCLVPRDPDIRITGQNRNYEQSLYRLEYVQAGAHSVPLSFAWWAAGPGWLGALALFLCARLGFAWWPRTHLCGRQVKQQIE